MARVASSKEAFVEEAPGLTACALRLWVGVGEGPRDGERLRKGWPPRFVQRLWRCGTRRRKMCWADRASATATSMLPVVRWLLSFGACLLWSVDHRLTSANTMVMTMMMLTLTADAAALSVCGAFEKCSGVVFLPAPLCALLRFPSSLFGRSGAKGRSSACRADDGEDDHHDRSAVGVATHADQASAERTTSSRRRRACLLRCLDQRGGVWRRSGFCRVDTSLRRGRRRVCALSLAFEVAWRPLLRRRCDTHGTRFQSSGRRESGVYIRGAQHHHVGVV